MADNLTDEQTVMKRNKPYEPYRYRLPAPKPEPDNGDDIFGSDEPEDQVFETDPGL